MRATEQTTVVPVVRGSLALSTVEVALPTQDGTLAAMQVLGPGAPPC